MIIAQAYKPATNLPMPFCSRKRGLILRRQWTNRRHFRAAQGTPKPMEHKQKRCLEEERAYNYKYINFS